VQILNYNSRISGPLLDRIDLHLEVAALPFKEMNLERQGESSADIKARVDRTRQVQKDRYDGRGSVFCNGQMGPKDIRKYCALDAPATRLLEKSVEQLGLSARGYHRILKIARTIADMDGSESLQTSHVAEAVQYRRMA
jgi:magnesium chelatase family protein